MLHHVIVLFSLVHGFFWGGEETQLELDKTGMNVLL